jgi:hypothetical protein
VISSRLSNVVFASHSEQEFKTDFNSRALLHILFGDFSNCGAMQIGHRLLIGAVASNNILVVQFVTACLIINIEVRAREMLASPAPVWAA